MVQLEPRNGKVMLVQCCCGDISGVYFEAFVVTERTETTAVITPSIDYVGHFHTGSPVVVPIGDVDLWARGTGRFKDQRLIDERQAQTRKDMEDRRASRKGNKGDLE